MKNKYLSPVVFLLCFLVEVAAVRAGVFDNIGLNARPAGMGEAYTAVGKNIDCVNYNPAGISMISNAEFLFSYRDFYNLGLINQKYIGFSVPGRNISACFSWHRLGTSGAVEFLDYKEDTYIFTLAGRLRRFKRLHAGANFKFFRVFSEQDASGYGVDLGLYYEMIYKKLGFGIVKKNVNDTEVSWDSDWKDKLHGEFRFGVSYIPVRNLLTAVDFIDGLERLNIGFEASIVEGIAVRAGIKNINTGNRIISAGTGIAFGNLRLDYAVTIHRSLNLTHFFSLFLEIKRGIL